MRGATRAADVTNILNDKFLEFVRCLKEDLERKKKMRICKIYVQAGALCNIDPNSVKVKSSLLCGNPWDFHDYFMHKAVAIGADALLIRDLLYFN